MFSPLLLSVRLPTLLAILWRARLGQEALPHLSAKEPLSFIIFRLDSLGDLVLTTPLFRALKKVYPQSRCTVVVQHCYKSLLATNPQIDEILTLPPVTLGWLPRRLQRLASAVWLYWTQLRKRQFDFAISPRWDLDEHLATLLCVLTNAAHRVGYAANTSASKSRINRGFDVAYDICLPPGPVCHEVLRNLAVAEALGATGCERKLEVHITDRDRRRAARLLTTAPAGVKLIAIGIGARSPGRRWPLERYAETVNALSDVHKIQPVILCASAELEDATRLDALLRKSAIVICGVRLREVCAVLERCDLFIGNDSGCAHLAAAMDCKIVVISRHPRSGDANHFNSPARFAPYASLVRMLQPAAGLDSCTDACREPSPHCITGVVTKDVLAAASLMLSVKQTTSDRAQTDPRVVAASQGLLRTHSADAVQHAVENLRTGIQRRSL